MSATRPLELFEGDLSPAAADYLLRSTAVAWDIETSGLDWRSDRIGLCQVFAPGGPVFAVRPMWRRPERLVQLLHNASIRKIFHHAMFDLRFMCHQWGVSPENVGCTKIASKLLDPKTEHEHSLKDLLQRYLGVSISKAERTSDWFAPNLTEGQLQYAATDVVYLMPLMGALVQHLRREKILDLAYACFAHLPARVQLELLGYGDLYSY